MIGIKNFLLIIISFLYFNLVFGQNGIYEHPIPYDPETYVCYWANDKLIVDGKDDEASWQSAPWTADFVDIEGDLKPRPHLRTRTKMLWDDDYFYFYALLEEPHVWATLKNRDDIIFHDDDFEIFIDPDGDTHNYYELEINALNTLWDLFLIKPYREDPGKPKALFNWNIPDIKTAVHINGTLNDPTDRDQFWSVEIAIPWHALIEFAPGKHRPAPGDQWRVNFSRVDWSMEINDGQYVKAKQPNGKPFPEKNWVWSPTGRINMHMPEMWGYVQFSERTAGERSEPFVEDPDQAVKWALWNLYHQQKEYYRDNDHYSSKAGDFAIPVVENCSLNPRFYATPRQFEIEAASCDGKRVYVIRQDGRLRRLSD